MNKTFAGFWRDGAKVKPQASHCDSTSYVVAMDKKTGEVSCAFLRSGRRWEEVHWLDTTTPTELTPQEAFELLKTITPTLERIEKHGNLYSAYVDERISIINWGDTTEHPPKQKWRVPTDSDKGKKCRFRDDVNKDWTELEGAKFICAWQDGFLIEYARLSPASWRYCEVLDEAA